VVVILSILFMLQLISFSEVKNKLQNCAAFIMTHIRSYEGVAKIFRTESITKCTLTTTNTR
jgi:hypothetical protein